MAKKRNTTLKEIAQELRLSISTVSRALNDHPDINPTTIEKVKKLAFEMNYVPNIFAKGLRSHKTNIIGVIVPHITHYFTSTILNGILEEVENRVYKVMITESKNDIRIQTELLQKLVQFGVDGILMSLSKKTEDIQSVLETLDKIPLVLFDKVSEKIPCTQIVINEEEAAFNAIEHLIYTGKNRIAIIKESRYSFNSEKRYSGYIKALHKHNLPIDDKIILTCDDINMDESKKLTEELLGLRYPPDAIFAITDKAAIGVIKTLKRFSIKIPEEIAVVGFSNSLYSTIIEPNLTTVDQPGKRIGTTAVSYLIEEIESDNETILNKTIEIKTNLIVRESSIKSN